MSCQKIPALLAQRLPLVIARATEVTQIATPKQIAANATPVMNEVLYPVIRAQMLAPVAM
jgi:hypothetical protein